MGLYDTFIADNSVMCKICKIKEFTWQTKELQSLMDSYRAGDRIQGDLHIEKGWIGVYTNCTNFQYTITNPIKGCSQSWEAMAIIKDNKFTGEVIVIRELEIKGVEE